MAKVVLISGSPRVQGNTRIALEKCSEEIEERGLETEIISLSGREIKACVACYQCQRLGQCALDDSVNGIISKIKKAQGLIVGAPVYFGTARGDLMNLLQRVGMVSRRTDGFLSWMVGGPVAVARRGGLSASFQEMLMFYLINEMIVPGASYWSIVFGSKPGEVINDEEGMATLKSFAGNVAKLIQKLH